MKKISFICIVSICVTTLQTNAQMRDTTLNLSTHKVDATSLLQKSKNQKTTAWILLGGGAGLATAGYIIDRNAGKKNPGVLVEPSSETTTAAVLLIAGGAAIVGSVTLFIASGKNKRKANLMLKNETVFFNPRLNVGHIPALGIKINL